MPSIFVPTMRGIAIERGHDAKPLRGEALVAQQGPAHVADADHRDDPLPVGAQNAADLGDQLVAAIADARDGQNGRNRRGPSAPGRR